MAVLIVLLTLLATGLGTGVSLLVTRAVLHGSVDDQLRQVASHSHENPRAAVEDLTGAALVVWTRGGDDDVAVSGGPALTSADRAVLHQVARGRLGLAHITLPDRDEIRLLVAPHGSGRQVLAVSDTRTEHDLARLGIIQAALWLPVALAAATLGTLATRRITRPLRDVAATASAVATTPVDSVADAVTRRVERTDTGVDEVDAVSQSVNGLLGQVERALERRDESEAALRAFLADVGHELRTPIAVIRSHADLVASLAPVDEHPASDVRDETQGGGAEAAAHAEQIRASIARISRESVRMGRLVDDLLVLARLEGSVERVDEPIDVTFLVLEALSDATTLAPQHHWAFDAPDALQEIVGDEAGVRRVITNLVTNAWRHTPAGTTVRVALEEDDGAVVVSVSDDGPGLPQEIAAAPGQRFARPQRADSGGSGLGLAITVALVESMDGRITFTSSDAGTRVRVWLPTQAGPTPA